MYIEKTEAMSINKEKLQKAIIKIFSQYDKSEMHSLNYYSNVFNDMSDEEIYNEFINAYTSDEILDYVNRNLKTLYAYEFSEKCFVNEFLKEIEKHCTETNYPVPQKLIEEKACLIGTNTNETISIGEKIFNKSHLTYITESGKVISVTEQSYCCSCYEEPDFVVRSIGNEKIFTLNELSLTELVEECYQIEY